MNVKFYQLASGISLIVDEEVAELNETWWNYPMAALFTAGRDRPVLNINPFPFPLLTEQTRFRVNMNQVLFEMELPEKIKMHYEREIEALKAAKAGIMLPQAPEKKLVLPK